MLKLNLGRQDLLFYDEREYQKYVQNYNKKYPTKQINKKYYKGLGTSSSRGYYGNIWQKDGKI